MERSDDCAVTAGYPDIEALETAFDASARDAERLLALTGEPVGTWRPRQDAWSIAECLDHIATGHRVYLAAMRPAADRAALEGRRRRGPARPGLLGGLFVWSLEPPVTRAFRMRAPGTIRPRPSPPLADASRAFVDSHREVVRFLRAFAAIDLAGVRFPNPFVPGIRFSLATGLHVLAAHERRHLWQAWRVRDLALAATPAAPAPAGLRP